MEQAALVERPRPTYPPSVLQLAALPNAVGSARRHTRDLLPQWGCEVLLESSELLVSELVTNAIKASGMVTEHAAYAERHQELKVVKLRLFPTDASIVIEVWDANPSPPVRSVQDLTAENGRGLLLVEMLSVRWDVYFPKVGGKVVWCEVQK